MNLFGTVRRIWAHGDDEEENDRDFNDADNDDLEADYSRASNPPSSARSYAGFSNDAGYEDSSYSSAASGKYGSSAYPAGRSSSSPSAGSGSGIGTPSGGSSSGGSGGSDGSGSGGSSGSSSGGSSGYGAGRMRSANPTLRAREKNIYTIKPKRLDEATVAADCLKTGAAVIVNLESVDRVTAVRIVDFMSGVCYGLDGAQGQPGHAMKLGEMIFLFTPAEFEITSDETDYAANNEHFFREMTDAQTAPSSAAAPPSAPPAAAPSAPVVSAPAASAAAPASGSSFASSYNSPSYGTERRPWE